MSQVETKQNRAKHTTLENTHTVLMFVLLIMLFISGITGRNICIIVPGCLLNSLDELRVE